jgi:hypothetical protein
MKNKLKTGQLVFMIWSIFHILTLLYFGWNLVPQPFITVDAILFGGFIGFYFIQPLSEIYEQWVNNKLNK